MIPPIATATSLLSRYSLALSLVDSVRDELDATVRHFSHLVALSTIAVAVGVLMEAVELVHAAVEWRKRKRREKREHIQLEELRQIIPVVGGSKHLSSSHAEEPIWAKRILRVGLILVVAGVVGEWRYEAKLEDAHNAVHQYDLGKILEADQKAGDAVKSANEAHDLGVDLVAKYKAAEHEIAELKAEKLPRRLSSSQKTIFRKAVTSFAPRWLDIGCFGSSGEIRDFEGDFLDALGLLPSRNCTNVLGVTISVPPIQIEVGADRKSDGELLVTALISMGMKKQEIIVKPNDNKELLVLTVGPKAP